MLPPRLKAIYDDLLEKGERRRSTGEEELFEELRFIQQSRQIQRYLEKEGDYLKEHRVVSGPGRCPCCGS